MSHKDAVYSDNKTAQAEVCEAWRMLGILGLLDTIYNHICYSWRDMSGSMFITLPKAGHFAQNMGPHDFKTMPLRIYNKNEADGLGVNPDGLFLHSRLHTARNRPGVTLHTHSLYATAVANTSTGLMPLTQTAIEFVDQVEIISYEGLFRDSRICSQIEKIGLTEGIGLLQNHGLLVAAETLPEAVYMCYFFEQACKLQVLTLSQHQTVILPDAGIVTQTTEILRNDRRVEAQRFYLALAHNLGLRS